ncbi:SsrA-binding protein SmpB [Rathayibacter oskolensis]|nr:SsrA-binding protein SmpB [Rathayibacter oskolensis]WKK70980.1 SsrA-binding protein SmpB [Rathayibacter oskolensis]
MGCPDRGSPSSLSERSRRAQGTGTEGRRDQPQGAPRLPHRGHLRGGTRASGTEVKSLRAGRASLVDGYAFVDGGEAWLDAVHINEWAHGTWTNHPPRRKRKLLLHKAQILKIHNKVKEGGYTLIPLSLYFSDGKAKVELAVAKGKKDYDKRQVLRERQDRREADRAMSTRRRLGE